MEIRGQRLMTKTYLVKRAMQAMVILACWTGTAQADEAKKIDCESTGLKFDSPGFTVTCKDYSRNSVNVGQSLAASNSYSLYAFSESEMTFLDAFKEHVLGSVYYIRRSMEADLEDNYTGKFSNWAAQDDIGDYEIRNVTVAFSSDDEMECIAFRKLGARRYEGINGLTVGLACSDNGQARALEAVKVFISQD
jgi:hypothetical protein